MIIYAEYVFLENFIMNYFILSLTGKFAKFKSKRIKFIMASSLGALYAFVIFFPFLLICLTLSSATPGQLPPPKTYI
jgi:stage II sporulation protein GA (sporulation sigma-E factor processing peptidase)